MATPEHSTSSPPRGRGHRAGQRLRDAVDALARDRGPVRGADLGVGLAPVKPWYCPLDGSRMLCEQLPGARGGWEQVWSCLASGHTPEGQV
jgi:hypothetical protein